jgi:hypothetical protein
MGLPAASLPKTRELKHQISRSLIQKVCHPLAEDSTVQYCLVKLLGVHY